MRCKSRDINPAADALYPGEDKWLVLPNGDRTCSFCGSMHPDDFLDKVRDAVSDGGTCTISKATGKNYKWYVNQPDVRNASEGGIKFYGWHKGGTEWMREADELLPVAIEKMWQALNAKKGGPFKVVHNEAEQ